MFRLALILLAAATWSTFAQRSSPTAVSPVTNLLQLVQLLNEDLAGEYQAIIAYTVYSQVLKGAAYTDIARELEAHAGEELAHAIKIAKQIDYLGGMPGVTPKPVKFTSNPVGAGLRYYFNRRLRGRAALGFRRSLWRVPGARVRRVAGARRGARGSADFRGSLSPGARPTPPSGQTPAPAELRATALFVAPGEALTALPASCAEPLVDGKPAKVLRADAASGLTLIGGEFGAGARAPTVASGATDLVALSLSAAAGKPTLEASPGAAAPIGEGTFAIVAALAKSAGGAPVFIRPTIPAGSFREFRDSE